MPKHIFRTATVGRGTYDLDIPANTADVRSDGYAVFKTPVKLVNFNPHMHSRGKRQCIEVIYPTGRQELLNCAKVSFGWATVYNYADDVAPLLPAGSVLHVINWHDNTAALKTNPDARQWVGWGNRTIDEMNLSWISWHSLTEDEYQREVGGGAPRRCGPGSERFHEGSETIGRHRGGRALPGGAASRVAIAQIPSDRGQNVVPVYEGWQRRADGSFDLWFGYYNRNYKEQVDAPLGEDNGFAPGEADRGQPTHFDPRRGSTCSRFVCRRTGDARNWSGPSPCVDGPKRRSAPWTRSGRWMRS